MTDYTLHFGFRSDAPYLGTNWGSTNNTYRVLEYALATSSSNSAMWFKLPQGHTISVVVWDLSSSATTSPSFLLAMSPTSLDGTTYSSNTNSPLTISQDMSWATGYFSFCATNFPSTSTTGTSPWGSAPGYANTTDVVTAASGSSYLNTNFGLSFLLTVTSGSSKPLLFISDPEPRIIEG